MERLVTPESIDQNAGLDQIKVDKLIDETKAAIRGISAEVFSGEIDVVESIVEMNKLTRGVIDRVAGKFAEALQVEVSELPFALFLFGSSARNLMLPSSDLDIGLVFTPDCPEEVKSELKKTICSLPFEDEVDLAHWDSIESMKKENCPSVMEQNKAVEARFIAGNADIARQHKEFIEDQDTREEKEKRFIIEYWILHKFDYRHRSSEHGSNLKYDYGASRDIVFLDWYYALDATNDFPEDQPPAFLCLDRLLEENFISQEDYGKLRSDLELTLLVKLALWERNKIAPDEKLSYLNDFSLEKCYEEIGGLLEKRGINNSDELSYSYYQAKGHLHKLVSRLHEKVADSNPDSADLWEMAQKKTSLDDEVLSVLGKNSWYELVPFAIRSTSPEILRHIVKQISDLEGYEYVLRIISGNRYINDEIKRDLLSSRLDKRFKARLAVE